jgi:asparagine synthase (glutamine-hydrolysing)
MCGIAGIFDTTGRRDVGERLLEQMTTAIAHRGPDGHGYHVEPGVGLGHRRLSIIDLEGGRQPLYNEDGSVAITFNGEIYNFLGLRRELERAGHRFTTRSDTETIVHAWEEWGERCVDRLGGMFAFAIWDRNQETLFLARDRLGKKPLYYATREDGTLVFASELKALLVDPRVPRELEPRAVEEYLAFGYVPDPRTILRHVFKLAPAQTMLIRRGRGAPRVRDYWDVAFRPVDVTDVADTQRELVERVRSAVRDRLISEVPLGAFLSGGVDSSSIVALMAGLSSEPVNTCSISFGEREYDESAYAALVAQRYGTDHRVERVDPDDFDLVDKLVGIYDEPYADSSAMPTYRVCELARRKVTVALSGDGGDESFAGYRRYRWHRHEERVRAALPLPVRRAVFGTAGAVYPKMDWAPRPLRAKSTLQALARDSLEGYLHSVSLLPTEARARLYSDDFRRRLQGYGAIEVFRRYAEHAPTDHPLSLVQYLDFKTYLPGDILTKVDRASMAHSLEVRVPLLDYELVDWVSGLPPELKLKEGQGKYIYKKAFEPYLPADILYRPKMGFAVPLAQWFRGPLRERVRAAVAGERMRATGIFDVRALERLVDQHQSGARDHTAILWALLMFEGFHRNVFP